MKKDRMSKSQRKREGKEPPLFVDPKEPPKFTPESDSMTEDEKRSDEHEYGE